MRAGAALIVSIATLAAAAASMSGTAGASHPAARPAPEQAALPSWSSDGKQIVFAYVRYQSTSCCGLQPSQYRIVRTPSEPGGAIRTVRIGHKGVYPPGSILWTTHLTDLLQGRRLAYNRPFYSGQAPQWSPDGSRLVFAAHHLGGRDRRIHVWAIPANGHDLTKLG